MERSSAVNIVTKFFIWIKVNPNSILLHILFMGLSFFTNNNINILDQSS